jgi:hypothetical protein
VSTLVAVDADQIRRAVAAFTAVDDRMDPRSGAAAGCWEAALTAAGLPEALARVALLEANRAALLDRISELSRGWHDVCCTLRPGHDKSHRSVDSIGQPSRWVTIHATEEHAAEQVAGELTEMAARAEAAKKGLRDLDWAIRQALVVDVATGYPGEIARAREAGRNRVAASVLRTLDANKTATQ